MYICIYMYIYICYGGRRWRIEFFWLRMPDHPRSPCDIMEHMIGFKVLCSN